MPQKTKKDVAKQGSGRVFFLVFNYIGEKGTSKSQSSKQDPVSSEQKTVASLTDKVYKTHLEAFPSSIF